MDKDLTISVPEEIYNKLDTKAKDTNFDSIHTYLNYILKQLCEDNSAKDPESEEEKAQKQRLIDLGYV